MKNSFREYFLLMLFFFSFLFAIGQTEKIDSLQDQLKYAVGDKKAEILNQLALEFVPYSKLKAIDFAERSKKVAIRSVNKDLEAAALFTLGIIHYSRQEYDITIGYYKNALEAYKESKHKLHVAQTLTDIGKIYHRLCE